MTTDNPQPRVTIHIEGGGITQFEVVQTGSGFQRDDNGEINTTENGNDKVELNEDGSVTITTD